MKIKFTAKNADYSVFYKEEALRTSEDIRFSIWNQSGNNLFLNQPATQGIINTGVYYFDFTTPSVDSYLLILCTDGVQPKGTILQVGTPAIEQSFYLRGDLDDTQTVTYEIYDTASTTLDSGTMSSVVSGFYSVNVSALAKPWFLRVVELVHVS